MQLSSHVQLYTQPLILSAWQTKRERERVRGPFSWNCHGGFVHTFTDPLKLMVLVVVGRCIYFGGLHALLRNVHGRLKQSCLISKIIFVALYRLKSIENLKWDVILQIH